MEMTKRPEKSSFALTCSLLSQYIKEKGNFADLGFSMPSRALDSSSLGKPETYRPPTTMSLLPGVDVSGDDREGKEDSSPPNATGSVEFFLQHGGFSPTSPAAEAKEPEKAQLTMFYGGKVVVFDNFPAEKAKELMQIASKGQNFTSGTATAVYPSVPVADVQNFSAPAIPPVKFYAGAQPNFSDLPIARKVSIHRFLQKRNDRISAKAPYQLNSRNDSKDFVNVEEEISQPWLGLGPRISKADLSPNCRR
ncbi:protein TIFY 10a-like [Dendrobium catenatum]|uniref:protein TIFY 10a-like n=1 Tax=Dendrobium catenatum TaxID=906689 RepID=UPI0009F6BB6C|nr:protein TIFY 10a-like [Dendrobium catenatum]